MSSVQQFARVTIPEGKSIGLPTRNPFLLVSFTGEEELSRLFRFRLELVCVNRIADALPMDQLLGRKVVVRAFLSGAKRRYFSGICIALEQGERDTTFTSFRMEVAPQFWLWTRRRQSRIFQHTAVPAILQVVFRGLDVEYSGVQGTFRPRDYCVQYRETDFDFASRLMEEEGIYYFFRHTEDGHKMVLGNTPEGHPDLPEPGKDLLYESILGGNRPEARIFEWSKQQQLRSGKVTLWDHCFELPHQHLHGEKEIVSDVLVGQVRHKLQLAANAPLEVYDYPGAYAQRFDGIDRHGSERRDDLNGIFEDNQRTAALRMEEEALPSVLIRGASTCRHLVSGHQFTLQRHFNADGGPYVLTRVEHTLRQAGDYRAGKGLKFEYHNRFQCIPRALPFRPARKTPRPVVKGTQTAVVVGLPGEEIHCDKYGRVKVQFHWDRQGQNNANSSCWIRVGTIWAGKQWGVIHIPRIGQEVIVAFQEGDPDQPIIIGSVYNAEMMPPYELPRQRTRSTMKTRSSLNGTPENYNEIRFEDQKGSEQLFIHAEKNQDIEVENDETHWVGRDRRKTIDRDETTHVKRDRTETVDRDEKITIGHDRTETVQHDETIHIVGKREEHVEKDEKIKIDDNRSTSIGKDEGLIVTGGRAVSVRKNDSLHVGKELVINAEDMVVIQSGEASITLKKNGDILIKGKNLVLEGSGSILVKAEKDVKVVGSKIAKN